MLTVWKSRDMRIADLSVHGWEPLKAISIIVPGHGVWNAALGVGFRAVMNRIEADGRRHYQIRWINRADMEPCEWSELTDEVLDAIDDRLRQT